MPGSDFYDSTILATEWAQARRLRGDGIRSKEVVMNTEFFYKGPLRTLGVRYSGPPWIFLLVLAAIGSAVVAWKVLS